MLRRREAASQGQNHGLEQKFMSISYLYHISIIISISSIISVSVCDYRITEYLKLERTCKDHQVQLPAPHRTT